MALPHSSVNQRISFDEWKKIFPEKKLLQTSRLCWKHFAEEDIVKWKMIGEEFVHQKRWRLKKGAKPKHLLDTAPRTRNIRQPLTPLSTNQGNEYNCEEETLFKIEDNYFNFSFPCREPCAVLSNNSTTQCSSNPIEVMEKEIYLSEQSVGLIGAQHLDSDESLPLDSANISILVLRQKAKILIFIQTERITIRLSKKIEVQTPRYLAHIR
ncbi:Uncharacterized protein APZ42_031381 [Daphnia magna]|uniref:THAP-type domain-containing protein n=1 Tax=Daphnia magna TaxID=35525 RepID=A0A164MWH7_9CRUS|nr:Uncharacterized protein APZ42_031381 [Daphnia magna]